MSVDAPWGQFEIETALDFYAMAKAQLQYYLDLGDTPDPELTKKDIEGYDAVVASGSEDNAVLFLRTKGDALRSDKRFSSNLAVVAHLKEKGLWVEK